MKIAIIVPSRDTLHADFAFSLANLMCHTMKKKPEVELACINPKSSLIQKSRWQGVQNALGLGVDKILFIDSDQTFPADALIRLLAHGEDLVGATCMRRVPPFQWTATKDGTSLSEYSIGLNEVDSNGFPFCLVSAEVFQAVHPDNWFRVTCVTGQWTGEDQNFCQEAKDAGYKVMVDADLSKEIGHIGLKIY